MKLPPMKARVLTARTTWDDRRHGVATYVASTALVGALLWDYFVGWNNRRRDETNEWLKKMMLIQLSYSVPLLRTSGWHCFTWASIAKAWKDITRKSLKILNPLCVYVLCLSDVALFSCPAVHVPWHRMSGGLSIVLFHKHSSHFKWGMINKNINYTEQGR